MDATGNTHRVRRIRRLDLKHVAQAVSIDYQQEWQGIDSQRKVASEEVFGGEGSGDDSLWRRGRVVRWWAAIIVEDDRREVYILSRIGSCVTFPSHTGEVRRKINEIDFKRANSQRGSNSAVECQLPKLDVAGSIPVSRSENDTS